MSEKSTHVQLEFNIGSNKYQSIAEFAKKHQLTEKDAVNILLNHANFDSKTINNNLKTQIDQTKVNIAGNEYTSVQMAANMHHIPVSLLKKNLNQLGYKTNLVFSEFQLRSTPIEICNRKFKSLTSFAKYAGLTNKQARQNIKQYGTQDKRVYQMNNLLSKHKIKLAGLLFNSKTQAADYFDMSPSLFLQIIKLSNFEKILIDNENLVRVEHIKQIIPQFRVNSFNNFINGHALIYNPKMHQWLITTEKLADWYKQEDFLK